MPLRRRIAPPLREVLGAEGGTVYTSRIGNPQYKGVNSLHRCHPTAGPPEGNLAAPEPSSPDANTHPRDDARQGDPSDLRQTSADPARPTGRPPTRVPGSTLALESSGGRGLTRPNQGLTRHQGGASDKPPPQRARPGAGVENSKEGGCGQQPPAPRGKGGAPPPQAPRGRGQRPSDREGPGSRDCPAVRTPSHAWGRRIAPAQDRAPKGAQKGPQRGPKPPAQPEPQARTNPRVRPSTRGPRGHTPPTSRVDSRSPHVYSCAPPVGATQPRGGGRGAPGGALAP